MKKGLIIAVMLASVLTLGYSDPVQWNVNNLATWIEAVGGIRSGGNNQAHIITVTGTISVPPTVFQSEYKYYASENTFGSVENITVTLEGSGTLTVSASNGFLLQVGNGQKVVVKDITLKGRDNNEGSVVLIRGGEFIMEGKAMITGNKKKGMGGGVYVDNGTFIMKDNAAVSKNSVNSHGGGVYVDDGSFIIQDNATVSDNTTNRDGGGVHINRGTFTMKDNASVKNNTVSGVYIRAGTFTMQDKASVKDNIGTGVYIDRPLTFFGDNSDPAIMQDNASVSGNSNGGVYVYYGTFTMKDNASVSKNSSIGGGGGVHVRGNRSAIFTLQGNASVTGNTASSGTSSNDNAHGGGVHVAGGTFILLDNATVSDNSAISRRSRDAVGRKTLRAYGGAVYISGTGVFTMKGGTISGNSASTVTSSNADDTASYGGGVYADSPSGLYGLMFTLESGTIVGNTAGNEGGGIYAAYTRSFVMQGGTVAGNTAGGKGGGVYVERGTFTKTGGTIYGSDDATGMKNTSRKRQGNAVYQESGPQWRNTTAGPSMNHDTYGFWLNEVEEFIFPSGLVGTWKRANFSNMLTFTGKTIKISSNSYTYELVDISGDLFTMKRSNANPFSLTFKLTNGSLVISGDSGNGQDNWNGTWIRQ